MPDITDYLTTPGLLCQLAEECAELAQAALKLKRAMEGINPTPKSVEECVAGMEEEIADVMLCVDTLGFYDDDHVENENRIMDEKRIRWLKRLEAAHGR